MTPTSILPDQHVQTFATRAERFTTILDGAAGRWDSATPCDGWTVGEVLGHVIDTERDFLAMQGLDGGPVPDHSDPMVAWQTHLAHVTQVLAGDGVAGTEYDGYFGRTTVGATMADFYGWDLVIHGSDIARATGQEWSVSDDEAAVLHATADNWGDALYSEGVCAGAVPVAEDASPTDRLLARLGRDPHWQPA